MHWWMTHTHLLRVWSAKAMGIEIARSYAKSLGIKKRIESRSSIALAKSVTSGKGVHHTRGYNANRSLLISSL